IILVALGPLFAIILNFTIVFVYVKKRATISMMRYLSERYDVPDMATSPTYIRSQVMALVERELFMTAPAPPIEAMAIDEVEAGLELDEQPEPEPVPEAPPEPKREHIPPPPGDESSSKKDHIPPPPGDFTESVPEDDD
ncbi:MAG: hypothetical protein AM325_016080, partial [Candidatus Thorarchaeota archaeon SMTZ1-45]